MSRLSRQEISQAVTPLGWRYVLGVVQAAVPVGSMPEAVEVARLVVDACEPHAEEHLRVHLSGERVLLTLEDRAAGAITARDLKLAGLISTVLHSRGATARPALAGGRTVQRLEIAIDALDVPAVRPFWKAVLDYVDEPDAGPEGGLVDPLGEGPAVWFQQMDAPRPQRNRIHLDVSVPHDEAQPRLRAALAAGGTLRSDAEAPAFWVLADAEGNEACITTWQGRD